MKKVLSLLLKSIGVKKILKYIALGILSGMLSFLFIHLINRMVALIITGDMTSLNKEYVLIFGLNILLFVWTHKTLALGIINLSQELFWTLRKQVLFSILRSNYQQFKDNKSEIYSAIVSDVGVLTNASVNVIHFFTAFILTISCLVYLATISITLFMITLVVTMFGMVIYRIRSKRNIKNFQKARDLENNFVAHFNSILDGFKEIFMEPKKGRSIYDDKIIPVAEEAYIHNTKAFTGYLNIRITGQVLFYILISSILLYFGRVLEIETSNTISYVFTLLFLLGSIESIMVLLPIFARAKIAAEHLFGLQADLEEIRCEVTDTRSIPNSDFSSITIKGLKFDYKGEDKPFGIGPLDMDIQKGEAIFIYGGNGSGKSTLIHSLIGINNLMEGQISLNNQPIDNANYAEYKTLFSVVFSDFYLFNELFGIEGFDLEQWKFYLHLFELEDKVDIKDLQFSTTDLSTGQRKRLALIMALLENKPILVLDEWAADQDPYFRKKFYHEIIPVLKSKGITLIAVTHDDRYYHLADKLYKMDYGKLHVENVELFEANVVA